MEYTETTLLFYTSSIFSVIVVSTGLKLFIANNKGFSIIAARRRQTSSSQLFRYFMRFKVDVTALIVLG
jgi:hypothetical protein